MNRFLLSLIGTALLLTPLRALAQEGASSALASAPTSVVTVPVGTWFSDASGVITDVLEVVVGAFVTVILAHVPPALRTYITKGTIAQVDQLLARAISFGVQKAVVASSGTNVTLAVGSPAVATAVQYAIDHGPEKLVAGMGGAAGIEEKIIARLPLPAGVPNGATVTAH